MLIDRKSAGEKQRRRESRRGRAHPAACSSASKRLYLAGRRKGVECPLYAALTRRKRQRESRARPRFAIGEKGEHRRMLLLDRPRQHDDRACAARNQGKTTLRRLHIGQRPQRTAKPPDLHPQACAMRFIGELQSKGARDERVSRNIPWP